MSENKRPSWNVYFMRMAVTVASRATCSRKHVGCVLVGSNHEVLATGYNGSIIGAAHCDDVGHMMIDNHCVRTVHAESNAIAQAARLGHSLEHARCYVTSFPCLNCTKLLFNAGIDEIFYHEAYRMEEHLQIVHDLVCPRSVNHGAHCQIYSAFTQVTP